ncbi:MAG: STAS domain-containing protein [Planctomycetota bacterium]|nr:STAS domain-containing protein [Planctomycetota bacterium]
MKLHQQQHGAVSLLRPDGPLVEAEVPEFARVLRGLIVGKMGRVVVDLSGVPFVDSASLEALLDITDELGEGGQCLKLCAVNKVVRQVLELTEIDSHFDLYEDMNSAVRSFL